MLALRKTVTGVSGLVLEEVERPEPGLGDVRIAVFAAGICGTDLHILQGEYPSAPPVTLGHEVAGVVDAVGDAVDPDWIGVRVAPETAVSCRDCEWCRIGRPMMCPSRRSIGSGTDGGFAPYMVVPVRNLHRLPDAIGDHAAALSEPLACVCNALTDSSVVDPGDRVVVTGVGAMGILAAQVARAAGGRVSIMGIAADRERLAVAASLGFDTGSVDDPTDRARLDAEAAARGIKVAIECAGVESAVRWALTLPRPRGRYIQVGVLSTPVTAQLGDILLRELTVTSGYGSTPASWRRAMGLLKAGLVVLDPLVTDVLPLQDWRTGLDRMERREGIKTVFDPRRA
jgi:L-iditol 2-dehydrogenase